MPIYSTGSLVNRPIMGERPIHDILIESINNGTVNASCYMSGYVNGTTAQTNIAQGLFVLNNKEINRVSYPVPYDYFQFSFVCSQNQLAVRVYTKSIDGTMGTVALAPIPISRITSALRDDMIVTDTPFAAISFRRNSNLTIPEGIAASIHADGFDVLSAQPVRYQLVAGGTVNGTFVDYPAAQTAITNQQTALQVNVTCTTVTGGRVLTQGLAAGLAGAYSKATVNLANEELVYNITYNEPITLVVTSMAAQDKLAVVFRMAEQW